MAIFKEILPSDITTARSFLSQLVDVLQEDISSSVSRRKYQVFVTGGLGPGVTSSLFQTVYDQDFTLQTANPVFDMTVGIFPGSDIVSKASIGVDAAGKELFPSSSLMMREKLDIYRQFSSALLGDSDAQFTAPYESTTASDKIDVALFIAFKRLFARDQIKRETFAMKFSQSASVYYATTATDAQILANPEQGQVQRYVPDGKTGYNNLYMASPSGSTIFTDIGSSTNKQNSVGGQVGNIVDASNTSKNVGLMFYDRGIVVLDLVKATSASQYVSGTIAGMTNSGQLVLGGPNTETQFRSKFIPDFVVSASLDNIIDHIATTRFSGTLGSTSITFQNTTNINSTLIFCRASADEFNYSSNPTYKDDSNRIRVIDPGQEETQQSFTFITSVGLYDASNTLLAVAKLSRPVEKNSERDLTLRLRLDF